MSKDSWAPDFKDPKTAFNAAIKSGVLSIDSSAANYAGNYMYMGTVNNKDQFKNIITRKYL